MSEPQKPAERLIRPVKCHFCNQPMFYSDDERFEPEVRVTVVDGIGIAETFYAHVRCWNTHVRCWNERMAQSAERTAAGK